VRSWRFLLGLLISAAYTAVFLTLAVWRFRSRDITA